MIEAIKVAEFAEKNGWLVIGKKEKALDEDFLRYLTPQGHIVYVEYYRDGSIRRIVA